MEFLKAFGEYIPVFIDGLWITIELTLISAAIGFVVAVPLVLSVLYGNKFFKGIAKSFISVVRGTPLLVQLFFVYYGLPAAGLNLTPFEAALIGFILNSAAYQAEYMKGGFLSLTTEQMDAAYSIGLTKWESIRYIIFPQAFRFSIPALSNEMIYLIKYTSIAYIIQVEELFAQAKYFASDTFYHLEIFLLIGAVYLILVYGVTFASDWLEDKLHIPGFDVSHLK